MNSKLSAMGVGLALCFLSACLGSDSDAEKKAREAGDINRNDPEVGRYLTDPALTAVTREFGPSVISMSSLPWNSPTSGVEDRPWSSWWFPSRESELFENHGRNLSPLAKYDLVRAKLYHDAGRRTPPSAADYERDRYDPRSVAWEGLCDAWALASISHPEPKRPVTLETEEGSVTFSISDLKALVLKTYEAVDDRDLSFYGQRFTGEEKGWIFPDMFPEQFHRLVEVKLFEKREPFIMDHDPGVEVWSVPVYKANYTVQPVANDSNAVVVRMWLYYAASSLAEEKNFVGTKEVVREFNYVLLGNRNGSGDLVVNSGYWFKGRSGIDSRKDHPDYLIGVATGASLNRKSANPEIDPEIVDRIVQGSL